MNKKTISNTNLQIAPINFGGNVFGWTLDEKSSFKMLDAFVDAGFNFIDTADTYAWWLNGFGGQSETIIGKWIKSRGSRSEIILATKVGSHTKEHDFDISKKHILKSVDESLQRLQTDYIDLYYTHFDDNKTPVEETLSAYQEIIAAGKVRYIGASNLSPERLEASFEASEKEDLPRYVALQPLYNLVERKKYENEYAGLVSDYALSVFPYYSLAAGFLTGKYRSEADFGKSQRGQGAGKYLNEKGLTILKVLEEVANNHKTSLATISIAWLLSKPDITAPVVSATNKNQLKDLLLAPNVLLTDNELKMLDTASAY